MVYWLLVILTFQPCRCSDNIDVSIVNSLGQQLKRYDQSVFNGRSQASFDVSSFTSGLYFITIKSDGVTTTKKLLIK